MSLHSKIGASSMYRWSACPGSVRMSEGIESVSSKYAEEGTKAHEIAASALEHGFITSEAIEDEMMYAIKEYVNVVRSDSQDLDVLIEQKFDLSQIYPGLYGTADAVVYDSEQKLLRVYDFKYGQGIIVEAENNLQLMYYGLGALMSTGHACAFVELVIVQPRAAHPDGVVRRWRFDSLTLVDFAADLQNFAERTSDPSAPLNPGDHCRFCPAAGICPTLHDKALSIAQTEFSPALSYDPIKLSETLSKIDMLEDYAKAVRAFAYNEASHGRCPPGWKLVEKRATRRWRNEAEAAAAFIPLIGPENTFESRLKSPAQMGKIAPKNIVNELTISLSSGLTLVPDSDKRQAALSSPEKDFEVIE